MSVDRIGNREFVTLRQAADLVGIPLSWFYERSRRDALPGLRRVGKYVRLDAKEFLAALQAGELR